MQLTSSVKERYHLPLTDGPVKSKLKDLFHPVLMRLSRSALTFQLETENDYQPIENLPIIFAANHSCGQDVAAVCCILHQRAVILAGKQPLFPIDEFFFHANGAIFVDRKNKRDTSAAKHAMIASLKKGCPLIVFPEGTSNVTDNLLMHPMKWGIIEVAQSVHAQIIPVAIEYNYDERKCHIRFGKPMLFDHMDKQTAITELRDTLATMRWEFWERKSTLKRSEMNVRELRSQNQELLLSYKKLDYDYEKSVVFKPTPDPEEVFAPIRRLRESH